MVSGSAILFPLLIVIERNWEFCHSYHIYCQFIAICTIRIGGIIETNATLYVYSTPSICSPIKHVLMQRRSTRISEQACL